VGNLKKTSLNLISGIVCAVGSKLTSTQKLEYEFSQQNLRRKIVLTFKGLPEFCLHLANKYKE